MIDNTDILSLGFDELREAVCALGEPKFRAGQIFEWLHGVHVRGFDEMTNLSNALRETLAARFTIGDLGVAREQHAADGTRKYLFSLADGNCIETVAMQYHHGVSVCISTQVGCRMGCKFCASTQNGLVRNLTAGEMLLQVYKAGALLGERVDSVVLMGIGEPLDNFDNVTRFCDLVTDSRGYDLAGRAITLSTCGLVPQMDALAAQKRQLNLAISLHAPTDQQRSMTMPVNNAYNIESLIDACRRYFAATGRRVTFEYAVIDGQNNSVRDAQRLAQCIRGLGAHVNLIPVNPVRDTGYHATRAMADAFQKQLTALGVNATVRRTLGEEISAACGQLRREVAAETDNTPHLSQEE